MHEVLMTKIPNIGYDVGGAVLKKQGKGSSK